MQTVSVIIPAYNSAHLFTEAIESALAQTAPPSQIIVVNDGSTDDTEARLQGYAGRITVIQQKNQGTPAARNAALRVATGEWIALLDADDAWHPRKLELQLAAAAEHPEVTLLGTGTVDYPGTPFAQIRELGGVEEVALEKLLIRNYFTASSVIIRRSVVECVGEFDPMLPGAEDLDYWQRAAEFGRAAILQLPLTGYRRAAGSLSHRPASMETVIRRILRKLDDRGVWRGRRLLRAKAISQIHWACANLNGAAGRPAVALLRWMQSLAWYPFPYRDSDLILPRPRRAVVLLARLLHLLPPEAVGGGA
jgi:glycosyltransferase involved in cell wall biosynthesis